MCVFQEHDNNNKMFLSKKFLLVLITIFMYTYSKKRMFLLAASEGGLGPCLVEAALANVTHPLGDIVVTVV